MDNSNDGIKLLFISGHRVLLEPQVLCEYAGVSDLNFVTIASVLGYILEHWKEVGDVEEAPQSVEQIHLLHLGSRLDGEVRLDQINLSISNIFHVSITPPQLVLPPGGHQTRKLSAFKGVIKSRRGSQLSETKMTSVNLKTEQQTAESPRTHLTVKDLPIEQQQPSQKRSVDEPKTPKNEEMASDQSLRSSRIDQRQEGGARQPESLGRNLERNQPETKSHCCVIM
ncbi:Hypothetical protein PP7435_CHR4-0802 [Komagataella phaffii CBS 7435]|uniref:Uncharacterized protein n=2 Tax=Komagataella phaffii TaxID=460519 RepID=C4R757_KOMPG|nr:Hypothetical protein PAS_chr4_0206 [Komagataella phaffii GS115]AOA65204.1 GQ67_04523T0 [Komagataella phaffii]CAH2451197.1 Hypothetical protein BQ9382_C4-4230 [Komagataella phaffii CBS 7435]AOA70111.1 GQ68_04495T0 [Komagataella phaffii GS115]CAY71432.1 Hypothetical protein PAS_chr4_0206 [Komagataella phaffii GS115]CCA40956.1 Hypothetical protein PP7435_CHR4-0802 [Komagataella phaffii CBS 7435]